MKWMSIKCIFVNIYHLKEFHYLELMVSLCRCDTYMSENIQTFLKNQRLPFLILLFFVIIYSSKKYNFIIYYNSKKIDKYNKIRNTSE